MTIATDSEIIRDLTLQSAEPVEVEAGKLYILSGENGATEVVDTTPYLKTPERATGTKTVRDVRSFLEYLDKHGVDATEVWADRETSTVTAVIDANEGAGKSAGWSKHTVKLVLQTSVEWQLWNMFDKKPMGQEDFANFIEENANDIIQPDPRTFLEIAQTLQGSTKADWKSAVRLSDGSTKLAYEEETTATAGNKKDLEIPTTFKLALKPYIGGPVYGVGARFRFNPRSGNLVLTYLLDRPHEVLENAYEDIVNALRHGIDSETIVIEAGGDGVVGKEHVLPALEGITVPIMFGKP